VLVVDLQGNILRGNRYLEQLAGFPAAELRGHGWLEALIAPEDRMRLLQDVVDPALGGDPPAPDLAATATLVAQSGARRTIRWSCTPLRDATSSPYALLVLGHDVTDLLATQQRLLQSQRLATIGQVAAGLAHEARNALQRIQASAEMLELEVQDRPQALEFVRRIEQSQLHLHRLFDELRGYAAPIKLDRTRCRLSSLWREAWELLAPQRAGREARIVEPAVGADEELLADHFRMVQVFRNLLENALAAAADPVRIEMRVSPATLAGRPALRIAVRDNGSGIPPSNRTKVFEPFFTTKPKGTGLGMAIAQRLVEAHGGTIEVGPHSPGAEIIVTLPRGDGP
jgi:PAS domain S-box-containing protein